MKRDIRGLAMLEECFPSGEIFVFLIARGKGRKETFQKLYWKLKPYSLSSSLQLPTRSRESISEISTQTGQ